MNLFNFQVEEILTFFAVLVRYSVLFAILPVVGDRLVPAPIKVLFALSVSVFAFPALVSSGRVHPGEANIWGSTTGGIMSTMIQEVLLGLVLGFAARLVFEGVSFGANLVGGFMGFATASTYDPHQETQTEVIAQVQTSIAMLIFLALDGHHLMFRAAVNSYGTVGLGRASLGSILSQRLIQMTSEVIVFGIQLAAPVAVSIFSVNIIFGIIAKAMPQVNILVLSFSVSALIGFIVMFLSASEFQGATSQILLRIGDWMNGALAAISGGG